MARHFDKCHNGDDGLFKVERTEHVEQLPSEGDLLDL